MSETIMCCGKPVTKAKSAQTGKFYVRCQICKAYTEADTAPDAIALFKKLLIEKTKQPAQNPPQKNNQALSVLPTSAGALPAYMAAHIADIAALTVPFVAQDKPALTRLLKNNIRHVLLRSKDKNFAAVWQTPEGQESIIYALEEAMGLGAELGKMGSLVPFGGTVEFIPAIEAYEFALTNGGNPPFSWIQIDMIHKNDIRKISRVDGAFSCTIEPGVPRGDLVAVAVYGKNNRLGKVIGELYDTERLLGKAERHSSSYKYYLQDLNAFNIARTEGTVKIEGSREFIIKKMFKKGGATWDKKLYLDEITNPYEGPDQPEMLRKAAGKSFLGKYAKVRNSEAAMEEMKGSPEKEVEKTIDASIDAAFDIVEQDADNQDVFTMDVPANKPEPVDDSLTGEFKKKAAENAEDISDELDELTPEAGEGDELDIF